MEDDQVKFKQLTVAKQLKWLYINCPDNCYNNYFIITSRIAAREEKFQSFTEVEVADFDNQQIETFVSKWYQGKQPNPAKLFMQQLKLNQQIRELATNPLLLTLLCLVFRITGEFPLNRSELYKEGVAVLLKKWDGERLIKREEVYKNLSPQRKEDLLSQVAWTTFKRKEYFFKQRDVELYIADYIRNLPGVQTDPEALQLDSGAVLKSIEAQHGLLVERAQGIYSFSHLTFQEYLTARKIITTSAPQALEKALQGLVSHIIEKRWREVFLLAVGMLPSADRLLQLMKQQVDALLGADEKLQQFLRWVSQKSTSVELLCKPAAVRAFYFEHDCDLDRSRTLPHALNLNDDHDLALTLACDVDSHLARTLALDCDHDYDLALDLAIDLARALFALALEPELKQALQQLKAQLPDLDRGVKIFKQWWQVKGQAWTEQFRAIMIHHRNIGYGWQFSDSQKELLKQYYDANKLLVDCLNSDCYVSREVRQEIEDTLLLPVNRTQQTS